MRRPAPVSRAPAARSRALLWARAVACREAFRAFAVQAARMVVHTLRFGDWRVMEFWTASLATSWGAWFLLTPWSVMSLNPAYRVMIQVAHWFDLTGDGLWGFLLLLGGLAQFAGFFTEDARIARTAAIHLTGVWTFVCTCFIAAEPGLIATVTIPLYITPSIWVYYRITRAEQARDARQTIPLARRIGDRHAEREAPAARESVRAVERPPTEATRDDAL